MTWQGTWKACLALTASELKRTRFFGYAELNLVGGRTTCAIMTLAVGGRAQTFAKDEVGGRWFQLMRSC